MARQKQQPRGSYAGPVDILIEGEVLGTARVSLSGSVTMLEAPDMSGGAEWIEGLKSWRGRFTGGLDEDMAWRLHGVVGQLRTPDGRVADFLVPRGAEIAGSGDPPFDM